MKKTDGVPLFVEEGERIKIRREPVTANVCRMGTSARAESRA